MNQKEKRRFVKELVRSVAAEVVANISRMPDEWNGHELREYLADKFAESRFPPCHGGKRRLRAYRNEKICRNL